MCTIPAPYPQEFREDVVRVARSREDAVTLAQIAKPKRNLNVETPPIFRASGSEILNFLGPE